MSLAVWGGADEKTEAEAEALAGAEALAEAGAGAEALAEAEAGALAGSKVHGTRQGIPLHGSMIRPLGLRNSDICNLAPG